MNSFIYSENGENNAKKITYLEKRMLDNKKQFL